ncbi:hypothetical protein C7C56_016625 [Massilia glaciei]|uniref:Uncharacterized protein n=2 Tax=Massilia glaciei TaxID=1524097 RepID=A0A2U2HIG0_9BURK|nr:hypothetical protein C7C56_016625 [Massilia glaciei]
MIHMIAASQIAMLYWLTAARMMRLVDATFFHKNPAWLADHPEFKQRHATPKIALWSLYALGAAWFALLAYSAAQSDRPDLLTVLTFAPTLAWAGLMLCYAGVGHYRVYRKIPLPERRSAQFERRSLRDFVHPAWTTTCFALYAAAILAYLAGHHLGLIATHVLAGRMAGFAVIVPVGVATLLYCVRRKRQPIDDAWGPAYRQMEVRGNVVALYGCLIVVGWGMSQDFFGTAALSGALFFTAVNLAMQIIWLGFMDSRAVKLILDRA